MNTTRFSLAPLTSAPVETWSQLAAAVVSFSGRSVEVEFGDEPTVTYGEPVTVVERRAVRA